MVELRSLQSSDMDNQRVKILRSKGSRAYTMPEKSNALQSEPQRGDLNVHTNLSAIRHAQCTFTTWARAVSISRQSALIAWHNAFNFDVRRKPIVDMVANHAHQLCLNISLAPGENPDATHTHKTRQPTKTDKSPTERKSAEEQTKHPCKMDNG